MTFSVNEFRGQLTGGGARPALFQVQIQNPANGLGDLKIPFMVKAASLPAENLGIVEAPYFGRKIKLAGDRTYEDWNITVINDEDFIVKNAFEDWFSAINGPESNLRSLNNYKSQAQVSQFAKDGRLIKQYNFVGIWPAAVTAIETSWETTDTIEEFSVTLAYDYWEEVPIVVT